VPTGPAAGETAFTKRLETVKAGPVPLVTPPTVTLIEPVVAAAGTVAVIRVSDQLMTEALVKLNETLLLPWLAPKPLPLICT